MPDDSRPPSAAHKYAMFFSSPCLQVRGNETSREAHAIQNHSKPHRIDASGAMQG